MTDLIVACQKWPTNAHLLADVERLYFRAGDRLYDPTFNRGNWWKRTTLKPETVDVATSGFDFRDIPHPARSYHVVAYDPPYVVTGGHDTSTLPADFIDRYGMHTMDTYSPAAWHRDLIVPGLAECVRVSKRLVLVKAMNYTSSGKLWLGTVRVVQAAEAMGCTVVDWFDMVGRPARQPKTTECRTCNGKGTWPQQDGETPACPICAGTGSKARQQRRAARNTSTMLVLRRPR